MLSGIYTSKGKAKELQLALEGRVVGLWYCLVPIRTECGQSQRWAFGKCLFSAKWSLIVLKIQVTSTGNTRAKMVSTKHLFTNQNIHNKTFLKSQNFVIHFKIMSSTYCNTYYFIMLIILCIWKLSTSLMKIWKIFKPRKCFNCLSVFTQIEQILKYS